MHHHSACVSLFTSVLQPQCWRASFHRLYVSSVELFFLSLCCGWRLESWPNVLRTVCISCWRLTANNESIWGLHLRPPSLFYLTPFPPAMYLFFSFIFVLQLWLTVAWHVMSVHQSPGPITASSPMEWSILLKCWLSKSWLCSRHVMECAISTSACCTLHLYTFTLCWGASCLQLWPSAFHLLTAVYSMHQKYRYACTLLKL